MTDGWTGSIGVSIKEGKWETWMRDGVLAFLIVSPEMEGLLGT